MKFEVCINSYRRYYEGDFHGLWVEMGRDWEEIVEELEEHGFDLKGYDEELFVIDDNGLRCGEMYPYHLNEVLLEIDKDEETMFLASLEVLSFNEVCELLSNGSFYDIIFYEGMELIEVAYEIADELLDQRNCPDMMSRYFDYEMFARDLGFDGYVETKVGVILIP